MSEQPTTTAGEAPGEYLVRELLWIHSVLRSDLDLVQTLAVEVRDGKAPHLVQADITQLQTRSPLWQLKANCLYYCRFVHMHHNGEDVHLFPALRRSNPALSPAVDKLEADHRKVSTLLDEVESSANDLTRADTPAGRYRVVNALNTLAGHLLTHLAFEEEQITPTLRTWKQWPYF